jgi:hypothetical protein
VDIPSRPSLFTARMTKKLPRWQLGIVHHEGAEPDPFQRWVSEEKDVRYDEQIGKQVLEFIKQNKVLSVATMDRIIGCPHEEGVDYEDGHTCPACPFWENRDRWTGELNNSKLIN